MGAIPADIVQSPMGDPPPPPPPPAGMVLISTGVMGVMSRVLVMESGNEQ